MGELAAAMGWLQSEQISLSAPASSMLHKLDDALAAGLVIDLDTSNLAQHNGYLCKVMGTFLVKHDWVAAFGDAVYDIGNDFNLPFPHCAFEYVINGHHVIDIALQKEGENPTVLGAVKIGERWVVAGEIAKDSGPMRFAFMQIRALCVALDAEVAESEPVRVPAKRSEKRVKKGLAPLAPCHTINLARRHRVTPLQAGDGVSRKRLHFRRGHWRHYDDHKTWIKWQLVGDASLGFIEHRYSA